MVAVASPPRARVKASPPPASAATAATVTAVTARLSGTVGANIDAMWALREQKRALEADIKVVTEKLEAFEAGLMAKLEAEGMAKATGAAATVSISESIVATVEGGDEGWKLFHAFVKKTGYFHLLHRRISDEAYRELLRAGKKVPGLQPFTKKRLNLRALST